MSRETDIIMIRYARGSYYYIVVKSTSLAKGKKKYDKREAMKNKEAKREIERAFKERQRL